jgi:Transposase
MDVVVERCAGLDVHKDTVVACIRAPNPQGGRLSEVRTFGTFTVELLALRDWLLSYRVTLVAMESTGVFWRPVFYLLEDAIESWVVNAAHMRNLPGHKTDLLTELPEGFLGLNVRLPIGVATFRARDQRRGWVAGAVRFGGAAARVA